MKMHAAVLAAALSTVAAGPAPDSAGRRLRGEAAAIASRLRQPNRRHNSAVGRLDEPAFRARAAAVAAELAGDLRDPGLTPRQKDDALAGLADVGPLAAGVVPVLVAELHTHDHAESQIARVGYFCGVTRAMAKVAPRDPVVIRALADALEREPRGGGTCHRCACALEALAAAGPAAKEIAGPVLARYAREPSRVQHRRLEQAIEAGGGSAGMAPSLLARAGSPDVSIDDRAATLRALAKDHARLAPPDRDAVRVAAEGFLLDRHWEIRAAAAELLGLSGPSALGALARGLDDPRYEVRAAAARALARLGPAAASARPALVAALDPFLGTGAAAAEALVAIGPIALPDVEARAGSAPQHVRALVDATARAIRAGAMAPVVRALSTDYSRGPQGAGFIHVEVLGSGEGKAYAPTGHRVKARVRGGPYNPDGPPLALADHTLTVDSAPNALFHALIGRRAGDRLRIRLSPETLPDPYWGFPTPRPSSVAQFPVGTGADFEVEVLRVCEPVIWRLFEGGGIVGPIAFESHCR